MTSRRKSDLFGSLPSEWSEDLLPAIQRLVRQSGRKVVVLDDDPTGTQTVYDVPVLTEWSVPSLSACLAEDGPVFFVLTNSRSLPLSDAQLVNRQVAANLRAAAANVGRDFVVVSRSDSTLRGHYPGEVDALADALGGAFHGTLIAPFLLEGGRYTIGDVHYVGQGDELVPAAETEYARDAVFGYRSSSLREWVSERRDGRLRAEDVASLSLDAIRLGGPSAVERELLELRHGRPCVVNAVSYRDLEVVVTGLLQAEAAGRRYLYRTAASFVRVRAGLPPRGLLTAWDLATRMRCGGSRGGLVVAGSHIQRSTEQIGVLRGLAGVDSVEVSAERLLNGEERAGEIGRVASQIMAVLRDGRDALVYTSRRLVTGGEKSGTLRIGQQVSAGLVEIVRRVEVRPAWVVAKGGITSSDVATGALGIRRAQVLGQVMPGVPVWRTGAESRWPGLAYVVFPGNVGGPGALVEVVMVMRQAAI
jgi:uncharacterized protein YgbK (DUF1537 family)